MKSRNYILMAKAISAVFTPFYLPVVGLLAVFSLSHLSVLPLTYMTMVMGIVIICTVIVPQLLISLYRHYNKWTPVELGQRKRRAVPYIISICSYLLCNYILTNLHIPHFIRSIIIMALIIQVVCAIVNKWWKISTHTAAIGGVAGALQPFSYVLGFNPTWWLCIVIIISGMLGTSRMILRQHTLGQVVGGFFVGFACAIVGALI